eukprot:271754-Chlamydomonas_euryale.AAC.3
MTSHASPGGGCGKTGTRLRCVGQAPRRQKLIAQAGHCACKVDSTVSTSSARYIAPRAVAFPLCQRAAVV